MGVRREGAPGGGSTGKRARAEVQVQEIGSRPARSKSVGPGARGALYLPLVAVAAAGAAARLLLHGATPCSLGWLQQQRPLGRRAAAAAAAACASVLAVRVVPGTRRRAALMLRPRHVQHLHLPS